MSLEHKQAVTALEKLMPEIAERKDPKGTLLKYAKEKNLSPAELEKLGFVFNTNQANNHFAKNASARGSAYYLLDVPAMVDEYTTPTVKKAPKQISKSASYSRFASVTEYGQGIGEGLFKEVNFEKAAAIEAAAVEPEPIVTEEDTRYEELKKYAKDKEALEANISTYRQIANDYKAVINEGLSKIATIIANNGTPAEQDWVGLMPFRQAFHVATERYIPRDRRTQDLFKCATAPERLVRDRFGMQPIIDDIWEAVNIVKNASEEHNMLVQEREEMLANTLAKEAATLTEALVRNTLRGPVLPTSGIDIVAPTSSVDVVSTGSGKIDRPSKSEEKEYRKYVANGGTLSREEFFVQPADDTFDIETVRRNNTGDVVASLANSAVKANKIALQDANERLTNIMAPVVTAGVESYLPNMRQRYFDLQRTKDDAAAEITLQTLLVKDPIISKADPDQVVEIFNSIRNSNHRIAEDPGVAKYVIREALQYGGVDPTTYISMGKGYQDMEKGLESAYKNKAMVY